MGIRDSIFNLPSIILGNWRTEPTYLILPFGPAKTAEHLEEQQEDETEEDDD